VVKDAYVSIGQMKRDLSELINRVSFGDERVILTSRGKPKAVIVSIQDLERLKQTDRITRIENWNRWKEEAEAIHREILARRGGRPIDVDAILQSEAEDREERDDRIFGRP
jgi:prevent-host-death family protein